MPYWLPNPCQNYKTEVKLYPWENKGISDTVNGLKDVKVLISITSLFNLDVLSQKFWRYWLAAYAWMSPPGDSDVCLKLENHRKKDSAYCSIPKRREHQKHIVFNWKGQEYTHSLAWELHQFFRSTPLLSPRCLVHVNTTTGHQLVPTSTGPSCFRNFSNI